MCFPYNETQRHWRSANTGKLRDRLAAAFQMELVATLLCATETLRMATIILHLHAHPGHFIGVDYLEILTRINNQNKSFSCGCFGTSVTRACHIRLAISWSNTHKNCMVRRMRKIMPVHVGSILSGGRS